MTNSAPNDKPSQKAIALLKRIVDDATSSQVSLSEVLRLCMRLGQVLGNEELSKWAMAEARGYDDASTLPEYRTFKTDVYGTFSGWGGSRINNFLIPEIVVKPEHHKALFEVKIMQSVGELERLVSSGSQEEAISVAWSGDTIAYYQRKEFLQGYVLVAASKRFTRATIAGILEVIRTRVLEFVLAIEKEFGVEANTNNGASLVEPSEQEKVSQMFQTIIYGGENVSVGSNGTVNQQVVNVQPGDLSGLKQQLESLGLTPTLISELETAFDKDQDSDEQPGLATRGWLGRVMIMVGKGTLQLASTTAAAVVTAEIRKFLGLPPA